MLTEERKTEIIETYRRDESDSGSPEVQVALLTERIGEVNEHLKQGNRKDHASRRGLLQMVSTRNRLLRYLARTDYAAYQALIKQLGLRK